MDELSISLENMPANKTGLEALHAGIMRLSLHDEADRPISSRGQIQRWLIDLRPVFLRSDLLSMAAQLFWERYQHRDRFQVGAVETAAIPLLAAILLAAPRHHTPLSGFIVRKDRKTTGLGRLIEGNINDDPIILIDDILNSGASAEKARAALRQVDKKITEIFVVIDYRSARGSAWRKAHDLPVCSLFTLDAFGLKLQRDPPAPVQKYRELWRVSVPGGFPFHVVPKSAPVLVGERIFRGCDAGKMQAFDVRDGAVVWEHQAQGASPRKGIWSTPAVHDSRLYYGAYNGVVYCLDANTGREIWSQPCCEWVGSSPLLLPHHNLLYIGLEYARPWAQGGLAALDMRSGGKVWEHTLRKLQHGSAAWWRGGDLLIWGSADHQMLALEPRTGKIVWSFATRRSVKYAAAVDEERKIVAFASFDKSIYVLDAASGRKLGEWETDDICYTTPCISGNRLFCGSGDKHLHVIDLDRMERIAKIDVAARIYSSPINIENRIVFGTNGGRVIEVDQETLEVNVALQLPDAVTNAVVFSSLDRRVYVSTAMNQLVVFETVL